MLANIVNVGCELEHLRGVSLCNQILFAAALCGHIQTPLIPVLQILDRN